MKTNSLRKLITHTARLTATAHLFPSLVIAVLLVISGTSHAAMVKKAIEYKIGDKTFEGYLAYDDAVKKPRPGVLVTHDWLGLTDKTKEHADEIAKLGQIAFAVDIYGKGVRPKPEDAGNVAGSYKKDRALLRQRMQEGLKVLLAQPGVDKSRIAAIGYCFGGTSVLELARSGAELKSVVSFHGGLDSPHPEDGKNIKAHVLVLHGADDPFNPAADVAAFKDEMRKSKVDWQMVEYGGAVHSFTDKSAGNDPSKGAAYNALADKRSWESMKDFFKETL